MAVDRPLASPADSPTNRIETSETVAMPAPARRWQVIALAAVLCLAGLGAIVTLLMRGAEEQDIEARNLSQVQFAAALSAAGEQIGSTALDYGWWDEAYVHLAQHYDANWAKTNLTDATVIGDNKPIQGALVIGPQGELRYGLLQGKPAPADLRETTQGGLGRLIERARMQDAAAPQAVTGIVAILGQPCLVTVAPILPFTPNTAPPALARTVLVFVKILNERNLNAIGATIGIAGARLTGTSAAAAPEGDSGISLLPAPTEASVPLIAADGQTLGHVTWHPPAPGHATLTKLTPQISLVVIAMALLGSLALWQIVTAQHRTQLFLATIDAKNSRIANNLKLWHSTMEGIDDGITVFDDAGRLLIWNAAYARIWGIPPDLLHHGSHMADIVDWLLQTGGYQLLVDEAEVTQTHPRNYVANGRWLYHADGRTIEVRRLAVPDIGGFISISRDMTQSKHYEQELVKAWEQAVLANRAKSEFLANVSHELRTPLNAIIGFSEVLEAEIFGPLANDRYRTYVTDIKASGSHLLSLINDILDLSKIEAGKFELRIEPIDCRDLMEAVSRLIRPRAELGNLVFNVEMPVEAVPIMADRRALKQILINLLSNAVKFTPSGGRVSLFCHSLPNGIAFVVQDTGIGISPRDIETALAPFGQIDSHLARRYEGTGLGLPIVKGMCELHGGTLVIESEVNRGTTVTATILDQTNRPNRPRNSIDIVTHPLVAPRFT
ncbi:MAG: ATP-binding protein [Dongiaceae bacterium]